MRMEKTGREEWKWKTLRKQGEKDNLDSWLSRTKSYLHEAWTVGVAAQLLSYLFLNIIGSVLTSCEFSFDVIENYHLNSMKHAAGKFVYFFHLTLLKFWKKKGHSQFIGNERKKEGFVQHCRALSNSEIFNSGLSISITPHNRHHYIHHH